MSINIEWLYVYTCLWFYLLGLISQFCSLSLSFSYLLSLFIHFRLSSFSWFRSTILLPLLFPYHWLCPSQVPPYQFFAFPQHMLQHASSFMANLALPLLFFFSYYLSHVSILPHLAFVISIWLFSSPALLKYSACTFILICL